MEQDKLQTLKSIDREDKFREKILMNLFKKMELSPVHTHGTGERGKDIVCKEQNKFGLIEWIAVVAKVGKITGSTSGSSGFQTVSNQAQEAFSYPYKDPETKKDTSINKVLVITNEEIPMTVQSKIVDKFGVPGERCANVHFLGNEKLAKLIDEYWEDFWRTSADVLADQGLMTEDSGLVLYVLTCAHMQSQSGIKKKVERALTLESIQQQSGLSKTRAETALTYLVQTEYVEKTKKKYALHSKKTVDYLLDDTNEIRLLFAIKGIADKEFRFTEKELLQECKKQILSFTEPFVKKTISKLIKGEYVTRDEGRGKGHFTLKVTIDDERPYLDCWLKYLARTPTGKP